MCAVQKYHSEGCSIPNHLVCYFRVVTLSKLCQVWARLFLFDEQSNLTLASKKTRKRRFFVQQTILFGSAWNIIFESSVSVPASRERRDAGDWRCGHKSWIGLHLSCFMGCARVVTRLGSHTRGSFFSRLRTNLPSALWSHVLSRN